MPSVTVSLVSHGHGADVLKLIASILKIEEVGQLILTLNIPEDLQLPDDARLVVVRNAIPKGFGANHNSAFELSVFPFFCLINPDVEIQNNPFPKLLDILSEGHAAIVAPLVISPSGCVEDSFRKFPTFRLLMAKALGWDGGVFPAKFGDADFCVDWVAGMFMLFRRSEFILLKGFDEGFFLYYEDVDICVRAWKQKIKIVVSPSVSIIHDARRESHRRLRYLRWHLASMFRYFLKHWGRLPHVAN